MRLLISAYACEPHRGSEPMVGWRWAQEAERLGFDVVVLTRQNNRSSIEAWRAENPDSTIAFEYLDLSPRMLAIKRRRGGMYPYYYLWQWAAMRRAKALHRARPFDLIHHITFVTFRFPTFMVRVGPPVIHGPMGGGEASPWGARWSIGWRFGLAETLRDLINRIHRFDLLRAWLMGQATTVWATSEATRALLPGRGLRRRTDLSLAVAGPGAAAGGGDKKPRTGPLRLLYVGQFRALKGVALALTALADAQRAGLGFELTLVGRGAEEARWREQARRLGLQDRVHFMGWQAHGALAEIYRAHDVFLFPSTHDSGGIAPIEAMSHGLPVVCLDCGGPSVSINDQCGIKVAVAGRSGGQIVDGLREAVLALNDPARWTALSRGAHRRAGELTWAELARRVYGPFLPQAPPAEAPPHLR